VFGLDGAVRPHQFGISHYFMMKMHGETTLKVAVKITDLVNISSQITSLKLKQKH